MGLVFGTPVYGRSKLNKIVLMLCLFVEAFTLNLILTRGQGEILPKLIEIFLAFCKAKEMEFGM
jgi:hypothetical protein